MEYKLINDNYTNNYMIQLIKFYGSNPEVLLNPTEDNLIEPTNLDNMEEASQKLLKNLHTDKKIMLIVDCDVDGFTSSAIMWQYIKDIAPDQLLDFKLHSGKQHGLEDLVTQIEDENENICLVILPDSSSNDEKYHKILNDLSIDVLVLDHHEADGYSKYATVVNNQLSQNYKNKQLTGAGVVYQFCRYLDKKLKVSYANKYIDLAALGIISDMGKVNEPENAYIIKNGLNLAHKNALFQTFLDKQSYSIGNKMNSISIAFYVTPLINALIRVGTMQEKENLFIAFVDGGKIVPSTKRGEKGLKEKITTQVVRHCTNARVHQNKELDAAIERISFKIKDENLDQNKILIIELDEEDKLNSTLNGLLAMKCAALYQLPTLVFRDNKDAIAKGSARGVNNCSLESLKDYLTSTNLFEFCEGHANAFGQGIQKKFIPKLIDKANKDLAKYDFGNTYYKVNFVRKAVENDIEKIIYDIDYYHSIYGQGMPEPLIAIQNIDIQKKDLTIMGKNQDTVKIYKNGISYMFFRAKNFIQTVQNLPYEDIRLEIVGRANINEWNGHKIPQIFIDDYNIYNNELMF